MARFNNGLIFTNNKCIGCNKCISQCSIMAANISVFKGGKSKIVIDGDKCNHCGKCIKFCGQGAREYHDDTEVFFNSLKKGKKISLLVAPSFYMLYGELAPKVLGWLKSLGLEKIYDVLQKKLKNLLRKKVQIGLMKFHQISKMVFRKLKLYLTVI